MTVKNVLGFLLSFIVVFYIVLTLFGYFFADKLLFHPHTVAYDSLVPTIKLKTQDGATISALYLPGLTAKYTVIYSHGNAEDLNSIFPALLALRRAGFSVLAYDYHGYGESTGYPSEANTYADINAVYAYLTETQHIPSNRIVAYGRSLGAAVSADLASRHHLAGLVLESPFLSAYQVVVPIPLLFDRFTTDAKLKRITCPLLVLHGSLDDVIPFSHGKAVYEKANPPKMHLWVEGAHHNDLSQVAENHYKEAITAFKETLPK
jgi:fermentation-respiration switch protein FrsA (DUF1100 family)